MENTDFIQPGEAGTVHITNPETQTSTNRIIAAAGGAFLTIVGLQRGGLLGILAAAAGGVLLYKGASGKWLTDGQWGVNGGNIDISTSLRIIQTRESLYAYWRNLGNLPNFMKHLEEVDEITSSRSRWVAKIPGGLGNVEWEAEIIEEVENRLIAWRSLPDSEIQNSGEVRFKDAPGGVGTMVEARISYRPPAGEIGEVAAKLLNPAFNKMVKDDLERFKEFMQSGNFKDPGYSMWEGADRF